MNLFPYVNTIIVPEILILPMGDFLSGLLIPECKKIWKKSCSHAVGEFCSSAVLQLSFCSLPEKSIRISRRYPKFSLADSRRFRR
jgi:hypothetical protein